MIVLPVGLNVGDTVYCFFDSYDSNGASVTITGLAVTDIEIYKNGSTTQRASDNGYTLLDTDGIDFDGATGLHGFSIDTNDNSDAGFWVDGAQYLIHVNAVTIDSQTVRFSYLLHLGYVLRPTTAGRKLDVSSGGEAGLDWANIGSPTTTVNLSGTTIKTATDVETDTQDIQGRIPAALVGGRIDANVGAISGDATAADNLESYTDGTTPQPVNVTHFGGTAGTFSAGRPEVNTTHWGGSAVGSVTINAAVVSINGPTLANIQTEAEEALQTYFLHTLIAAADPGGAVHSSSLWAKHSVSGGSYDANYDRTTDSQQAQRDNHPANFSALLINASGHVSRVTLTDTVTTYTGNTPQTGDIYAIVNSGTHGNAALNTDLDTLLSRLGTPSDLGGGATVAANLVVIEGQTDDIGAAGAGLSAIPAVTVGTNNDKTGYTLSNTGIDALYTRALVESYNADGAAPTVAQAFFVIMQTLTELTFSGVTGTVKKLDGSTTAFTLTINDATTPTSITRAT